MFKIEEIINLSTKDIKDLQITHGKLIACGREGNIIALDLLDQTKTMRNPQCGFVNSLACFFDDYGILNVYAGCQNGAIVCYKNFIENENFSYLIGHQENVCCLEIQENMLISGSWDKKFKVWDISNNKELFSYDHPGSVWCARFFRNGFVTACADNKIRFFENYKVIKEFTYHVNCIRGLYVSDSALFSVSNEGSGIKSDMNGKILAHMEFKTFIYSLQLVNEMLVHSGEQGRVFVTDLNYKKIDTFKIPVQTCWRTLFYDNKIYVGGSDGKLFIFANEKILNQEKNKIAEEKLNEIAEEMENKSVSDGRGKDQQLKDPNYKIVDGEVYQFVNDKWILLGDVVEKTYDYTLNVDVENKVLKLSFNKNDNIYEVADRFLRKNKLKDEYKDDIVDFIKKNYKIKENYCLYEDLNIDGIKKNIDKYENYEKIIDCLREPKTVQNQEVEKILQDMLSKAKEGERFAILDCYRYLYLKDFFFDFSFLIDFNISSNKEALVFTRLITNLYLIPPFNLECFRNKIRWFYDKKMIDDRALDKYERNREIRMKNLG